MAKLHVREWGDGERHAMLLHGLTGSSTTWWKLGPALAARGYKVLAPDLRGHGDSPRGTYSVTAWSGDVLESVPARPDLALGLSLGGLVLAAAVERLRPRVAVYEDPAWFLSGDRSESSARFLARKQWTPDDLRRVYPRWEEESRARSLASIAKWDAASVDMVVDVAEPDAPPVPSLVLTADPSDLIPPRRAERLRSLGFEVRAVPDTGHVIHNDDFDAFLAALDAWLTRRDEAASGTPR